MVAVESKRRPHERHDSVTQKIHSHALPNGLTLVAEEMPWLESAAFALLMSAGCAYEPAEKLGLASLTCEMSQRGAGKRDSRQFLADLENLGADSSASVSIAQKDPKTNPSGEQIGIPR